MRTATVVLPSPDGRSVVIVPDWQDAPAEIAEGLRVGAAAATTGTCPSCGALTQPESRRARRKGRRAGILQTSQARPHTASCPAASAAVEDYRIAWRLTGGASAQALVDARILETVQ